MHGVKAHAGICDLADKDAIILVNNASGFGASDDEEGWTRSIDIDVMATVRASHAAIPLIEKAGSSAILNITSVSA